LIAGLYAILREVFEVIGVFFPIASVEVGDPYVGDGLGLQTTGVDTDPVGVRTRHVERLDTAGLTKVVLGDTGVEGVGGEVFFSADNSEFRSRYDQVEIGGHGADGAVAEPDLDLRGSFNLEPNFAAMTTAAVGDQLGIVHHGWECSVARI
jgi:hypothetical protein